MKFKFLLFLALILANQGLAQENEFPAGRTITQINFIGVKLFDPDYLTSLLESKVGSTISARVIAADINRIYQQSIADDIKVNAELVDGGLILNFVITEKKRLAEIKLRGNTELTDKEILEKLKSKKLSIINTENIAQDIKIISELYSQKKFYKVKVMHEINTINSDSVSLTYQIIEDPQTYITEINIKGAKFFDELSLKRRITSQQIDCFSWITSTGTLNEGLINNDLRIIYQAYLDNGFIRLKIHKPRVRILLYPEFNKAIVDITLEEGPQYFVASIDIEGEDGEELLETKDNFITNFGLKTKEPFSQSKYYADQNYLDFFYQDRGFAFASVTSDSAINDENLTLDVKYTVKKGVKAYINRVNFSGNQSTRDYVVRRELALQDKQLYRISNVQESQDNLNRLGFFEQLGGVSFQRSIDDAKNLDYNLNLNETLTGTVNLSLTFTENSGLGAAVQIAKRNLFGYGTSISLQANTDGRNDHSLSLSYTEPYFFGSKISYSPSISYTKFESTDTDDNTNYKADEISLGQTFGQPIWKNWTLFYNATWTKTNYKDISTEGLELLNYYTDKEEKILGVAVNYNTVNHPVFSSRGINFTLGYDVSGLIDSTKIRYDKLRVDAQYFRNITSDDTLIFMARYRYTQLFQPDSSKPIPPDNRLAIGGITSLRGFDYQSVGGASTLSEQDSSFSLANLKENDYETYKFYKTHQDGTRLSLLNLELLFPFSKEQSNVRGVLFYDAGNVWSEPETYKITGAKYDLKYYKMSYGLGVRVITPAGVLRFEYATIIDPKPLESPGKLEFYIGSLF